MTADWSFAKRIAFRFCFVYLSLHVIVGQMLTTLIPLPGVEIPELGSLPPMRLLVNWVAARVFHVSSELVVTGSGSGDKTFDWVEAFVLLALAIAATAIWSLLDRRRPSYVILQRWFRVWLRFAVGSTMLVYGFAKAIPVQMPFFPLSRLVEPFGDFSPMGALWYSIGASPAYEIFLGSTEILGGILVLLPMTATLGALVCLASSIHVFVLNMTYDVPVKLFSFHLILLSALLLAPEARRLLNFFFLNRVAGPSSQSDPFPAGRAGRISLAVQVLFGVVLVWANLDAARKSWAENGPGAPKSPLYGIWDVEQMSIDGSLRPALLTDRERWRRVLFQLPNGAAFQRMDESFVRFVASINTTAGRLALTKRDDKKWEAGFAFERPAPDQLVFDGGMDGHKIHMQLQLLDQKRFLLVSRGFHWIQEYPFNR